MAAHFFGHSKATLKQLMQGAAKSARLLGRAHGVFELTQDLRFAQDHGVQTCGNTKCMACGGFVLQGVDVALQLMAAHAAAACQPLQSLAGLLCIARSIDFGSVAG